MIEIIERNELSKLAPTKLFFLRQVSKLGRKFSWCPDPSSSWPGSSLWLSPPQNLKTGMRTMIGTRPKDNVTIKALACRVVIFIILHHRSLILLAKACSPLTLSYQGNPIVCWLFASHNSSLLSSNKLNKSSVCESVSSFPKVNRK